MKENYLQIIKPKDGPLKYYNSLNWLYVLVMSGTRFRVNPHSIVALMSRNSLLEAGAKSEVWVTESELEPRTT